MTQRDSPDQHDDRRSGEGQVAASHPRRAGRGAQPSAGPRTWRLAPEAWRLAARLSPAQVDRYLRLRTAKALPRSFRARFSAMRIPNETIDRVLGEIRSLDRWMDTWNQAAQRFLTEARREEKIGGWREAAEARVSAAMCFHAAHLVPDPDPRTVRTLRASSVTTFAQAVPRLFPETHKIGVPWRTRLLPAYLALPVAGSAPFPLLVMLNGATTCKEELLLWSGPVLEAGVAVLAIDWPGTGESASFGPPDPDCDDLTDAIVDLAAADPDLDPDMIALLGFSLGGTIALRASTRDRRMAGAIAVTPPFDPAPWWRYVNPLVRQQLLSFSASPAAERDVLARFSLRGDLERLRSPILLFGAGRDLVVPPEETLAIAADAGELATVCWFPRGSHGLYAEIPEWTTLAARWVNGLFGRVAPPPEAELFDPPRVSDPAVHTTPRNDDLVVEGDLFPDDDLGEDGAFEDEATGRIGFDDQPMDRPSSGTRPIPVPVDASDRARPSTRVDATPRSASGDIWDDDEDPES